MFASARDFLYRHKRKFIFMGVVAGGVTFLGKYAEKRLVQWGEQSALKIIKQQQMKSHYERSLNTTRVMLLEIIPKIRKSIEKKLDSKFYVQAIKEQPEKKRQLWEELKCVGFGRAISAIVCVSFAVPIMHIMMMILAARTLESETEESNSRPASQFVQVKYMSVLQDLIENQLPVIIDRIMVIVNRNIAEVQLTEKLTVSQLESILQKVTLDITSDKLLTSADLSNDVVSDCKEVSSSTLPWSQYLNAPAPILEVPTDQMVLKDMFLVTTDICNTDDFSDVINVVIQLGLNYVLDELDHNTLFTKPIKSDEDEDSFSSQTCSVVKLVPALSAVVENMLPNSSENEVASQASSFYNRLVNCSQLEAISFNSYSALAFTEERTV